MNALASKLYKRITNFTFAFVVATGTLSVVGPYVGNASAATITNSNVATLAADVAAANPGDIIDITASGTLASQVVINKPLTITSSNNSTVTVAEGINALGLQANDITIENLNFVGPYDIGEGAVTRALEVSSYQNITIQNNTFSHLRQPAYVNDNVTGSILNNYVDQTKGWVVLTNTDIVFSGNTFGTNVIDIALIAGATNNYTDAEVVAISDANDDAVVENQFGPTKRLSDSYVNPVPSGNTGDDGTKWNPYLASIQSAIDRVVEGGTVHVAAGSYAPANINKQGVIVKGAQAGISAVTRTHGAATESLLVGTVTYSPSFLVSAPNVTIDGFDFGPAVDGVAAGPVGVDLSNSTGATVTNSIFVHNQRGISLSGASGVTVTNNQISFNNANPQNNAGLWGDNVQGIVIDSNLFEGASNTAINLAGSQNITINGNTFIDNGNTAVIWQDSNVDFTNNYGEGFNGSGLFITGSSAVAVLDNVLTDGAGFNGVSISTASGVPSSDIEISGNSITGFSNGINFSSTSALSDLLVAQFNDLSNNTNAGINAPTSLTILVDGINNWWGDASGPLDTNAADGSSPSTNAGTGSAAKGAISYGPWCVVLDCSIDSDDPVTPPSGDGGSTGGTTTTTPTVVTIVTPIITSPASVLGESDNTADTEGSSDVEGTTDDKTATADTTNNGVILGLAWYWWILILAGATGLTWWILAAYRRRNNEE